MSHVVILSCLAAVCIANPAPVAVQDVGIRIVGGSDADIRDFPYQVSLQYASEHICGGVIISINWTLSAAHCVQLPLFSLYSIRAGSSRREGGGSVFQVVDIVQHSLFNADTLDYDFALLKVSPHFVFGVGIYPIALPQQGQETVAATDSIVTGWGYLEDGGTPSDILQKVTIPVTSRQYCAAAYPKAITARMICAGRMEGGVDSCQGDSGGPMVVNRELIGVTSWGDECATAGKPGVYAKVSSVRSWIDAVITDADARGAATSVIPVSLLASLCLVVVVVDRQLVD